MKILMINKFLHPNGGSETYIFRIGQYLQSQGHQVQYFGMEHPNRAVGNKMESYTANMDFHGGSKLGKLLYPIKTVYSKEARKKLRPVLEDFQPDVCHINNFNYQLTPSVILEIRKWSKQTGKPCKIIYTAHDYQLVCPNHMCRNPQTNENCEQCLTGKFMACTKGRCIHGSMAKSLIGTVEAAFWKRKGTYKYFDKILCCSRFMKERLDRNPVFAGKTVALHNFVDKQPLDDTKKQDYVLYFGRFSQEKGVQTLLSVCRELPDIPFVFAGIGPLADNMAGISNIKNVGFQEGEALYRLISQAQLTVYPSEWYENCPFSVMESQIYGTPVLGADIGGIPELIEAGVTGELFESGNAEELKKKIETLWNNRQLLNQYAENCKKVQFMNVAQYCQRLMEIYR